MGCAVTGRPRDAESKDKKQPSFVGVCPLDLSANRSREFARDRGVEIIPKTGTAFHVRRFSVEQGHIQIGESELRDKTSKIAFLEAELIKALSDFGVALDSLDIPAKSDYPI